MCVIPLAQAAGQGAAAAGGCEESPRRSPLRPIRELAMSLREALCVRTILGIPRPAPLCPE
jgi:hypothetical protein